MKQSETDLIKCRAWDKTKKKYVYTNKHDYICVCQDVVVIVKYGPAVNGTFQPISCRQLTWEECGNLILENFINRYDKNDKDIYKGDIVHFQSAGEQVIVDDGLCNTTQVIFEDGKYEFQDIENTHFYCFPNQEICEVIGTIRENPELLNKK